MGTPFNDQKIDDMMINRLKRRIDLKELYDIIGHRYTIAGGALLVNDPHDYDVYATCKTEPLDLCLIQTRAEERSWTKISLTRNALTMRTKNGTIVQFCAYAKYDAPSLIESFDFAHCQAGIDVTLRADKPFCLFHCTSGFMQAMLLQKTFFVGSEYPLSSLIRLVKYAKRGLYPARSDYLADMLRILTAIIERGYSDYEDFKDQLDAIDLNYEGEEVADLWHAVRDHLLYRSKKDTGESPTSDEKDDFPF